MRRRCQVIAVIAILLGGCATNSLSPIGFPGITDSSPNEECVQPPTSGERLTVGKARLAWYTCALRNKARNNVAQMSAWQNQTEWRDIPLMTAAATVAGLLLFGERDGANALEAREQDVISGIAFGSTTFAAFANYLSPETARRLLRQGARGHFCMANQGQFLIEVWDNTESRNQHLVDLIQNLVALDNSIARADPALPNLEQIRGVRDAGYAAVTLYEAQVSAMQSADVLLAESAWSFGLDLIAQRDRGPVDFTALVTSISEQTRNTAQFDQRQRAAESSVDEALVNVGQLSAAMVPKFASNAQIYAEAQEVAIEKQKLLRGLVNIESLVLGFNSCASTALAGGDPRAVRIQTLR